MEEANAVARKDLLEEWDDDYFESYEVTEPEDNDGMVQVDATCPEGEIMQVSIVKMKAPPQPTSESRTSLSTKNGKRPAVEEELEVRPHALAPKRVYVITQTDYDHHTDEDGRSHIAISVAYDTLEDANEAAREHLLDVSGEDYRYVELSEQNKGSKTKSYVGHAYVREDEVDNIKVEVKELSLYCAKNTHRCGDAPGGSGSRKRAKLNNPEDVIEISD